MMTVIFRMIEYSKIIIKTTIMITVVTVIILVTVLKKAINNYISCNKSQ